MRAREFLMKDAYSFDIDAAGMQRSYEAMHAAYMRIFTRLGLRFRAVQADSGAIGGDASQEFHVLADSGEDARSEEHTSELQSLMRISYAVFCLKKKKKTDTAYHIIYPPIHHDS